MSQPCSDDGLANRLFHKNYGGSQSQPDESTPFVHRFQTSRQKYVYDVNTKRIIQVGSVVWDVLEDYGRLSEPEILAKHCQLHGREAVETALAEIAEVRQEKGLFLSCRPAVVTSPGKERIEEAIRHGREQLTLNITEDCNLRCGYCVYGGTYSSQRGHSARSMTWEVAKRAVDDFLSHSTKAKERVVSFYGGEPLLNVSLMRQTVAYLREASRGAKIALGLTTNGLLLSGEAASFLAEHKFMIVVSLDGPEALHDSQRKTVGGQATWATVIANLRGFLANHPEYRTNGHLRFNGVATGQTDLCQVQAFFAECDLLTDSMGLELSAQKPHAGLPDPGPDDLLAQSAGEVRDQFIGHLKDGRLGSGRRLRSNWVRISVFEKAFLLFHKRGFFSPYLPETLALLNTCIPGSRRTFVNADGQYFACERVAEADESKIGNVWEGMDSNRVMSMLDQWTRASGIECRSCWCMPTCSVGCFATVGDSGVITQQEKRQACELHRCRTHHMLIEYCDILEQNPHAFDYMGEITLS